LYIIGVGDPKIMCRSCKRFLRPDDGRSGSVSDDDLAVLLNEQQLVAFLEVDLSADFNGNCRLTVG
jgi:hypothetical protein